MTSRAAQSLQAKDILLPALIDEIAKDDPTALWIEYPADPTSYDSGYKHITYAQFANAIDGTARWMEGVPDRGENGEALCYIGPNDPLYGVLIVAAVRAGYKMLLLSPRNTLAGSMYLLERVNCNTMLVADPQPPLVQAMLTARPMRTSKVPSLDEVLNTEYQHYPYEKSYFLAQRKPFVALHTSGSTGPPKPVIFDHRWVRTFANNIKHQPPPGYESANVIRGVKRQFSTFPFFQAAGFMRHIIYAVLNKVTSVLPLCGVLPTAAGVVEAIRHTSADMVLIPPAIIEEMYHSKSMLDEVCSKARYLVYAGGALPEQVGDEVSARIKLLPVYGSSELGETPQMVLAQEWPRSDWKYIRFNNCFGAEFRHHSENFYELVLKKSPTAVEHQPPFSFFPNLQEFPTCDLFSPHPTKSDLWAYEGRSDDLIVFLNGLKVNPPAFEHIMGDHPEIRFALMTGNQRPQLALLIEPVGNEARDVVQRAQFIERIWPSVQEANKGCPAHAKVLKTHIMVALPEKPFDRAGKWTVRRASTLELYSQELEALYKDADQLIAPSLQPQLQYLHEDDLTGCLVQEILQITGWKDLLIDDSLFITEGSRATAREQAMTDTFETYKNNIDQHYKNLPNPADGLDGRHIDGKADSPLSDDSDIVLLIGSTGALGANMLSVLMAKDSISHIYCLNRAPESGTLQVARSKALGLSTTFPDTRVTFLTLDYTSPNTSLIPPSHYAAIANTVTLIIHAPWPVDFNLPLTSFSSSLTSVSSLAALTASSRHRPSIIFISSIAAVLNHSPPPTLEAILTSPSVADRTGYGESKFIAEQLLTYGARHYDMRVTNLRLGQISGPPHNVNGKWTSREWLPSLVVSSRHLRKLPASLGGAAGGMQNAAAALAGIDWMPIDELAEALVESARSVRANDRYECRSNKREPRVLNMRNPHQTSWAALLPSIKAAFDARVEIVSVVEYNEWHEALKLSASATFESSGSSGLEHEVRVNPAIRPVDFFERIGGKGTETVLGIEKAFAVCPRLRGMSAVDGAMMRRWVKGWIGEGD